MLSLMLVLGPLALLGALVALAPIYRAYRRAPEPKHVLPLARYLFSSLGIGIVALMAGTLLGIAGACSGAGAGNLCGLAGVFGFGPLAAAVAIVAWASRLTRRARGLRRAPGRP